MGWRRLCGGGRRRGRDDRVVPCRPLTYDGASRRRRRAARTSTREGDMRHRSTVLAAALAATALAPAARAQIVQNGSFETPDAPAGIFTNLVGNALTGWTISANNIDLVPPGLWQQADGIQSIDLNGDAGPATIFQDVTLTPGSTYRLSFA